MAKAVFRRCPICGVFPIKEEKRMQIGGDGGPEYMFGRYACQKCGLAPRWDKCFCVEYGFGKKEISNWNDVVEGASRAIKFPTEESAGDK